jgi:uncharacterized protein YprB with RNaseH-like and TPR domain
MLRNTFVHISGIGAKTEARLWKAGALDWDAFRSSLNDGLSRAKRAFIRRLLHESERHLRADRPNYFFKRLGSAFHWRLFPEFRHLTGYLDIETTGMSAAYDNITVIGLYDGSSFHYYVKDVNLDDFIQDIEKYKVIITYNGKCFDVPFIREAMGLPMDQAHIDLRFVLSSLGFSGGLKGCERQVGISRGDITGIDGYDAVLLWKRYRMTGDGRALETLLAYNLQDVVNLETLMVMAYNMKLKGTPFYQSHRLPEPIQPQMPFRGHLEIIEKIRMQKGLIFY